MAASLAELKDLIKLALGTPETVNFKALNRLLISIIQRLGVLYRKTDSSESVEGGKKTQPARKKTRHEDRDKLRIEEKTRKASKGKDAEKKDLNEKTATRPEEKTGSRKSSTEIIPGTDKEKEAGLEEDKKGDDTVSSELKTDEAISNGEKKDKGKERKGSKTSSEENSEEAEDRDGKRRRVSNQSEKTAPSSKTECDYNGKGGTKKMTKKKSEDNGSQDFVNVDDYGSDYEDDFDGDEGSSSGSDPHRDRNEFVPKQDFDDIVKRLQIMEREILYSKGKAPLRQRDMGRGSSDITRAQVSDRVQVSDPAQVSIEELEKMEAMMKKRIELMGKDAEAKVAMIHGDMDAIMAQLDILPKPADLYKSYFPSWKMLEDALCKARPLKNNIEEVKDSYDMQTGSGVSKQMTKFLGAAGPTDTLFRAFEDLATLIERNKKSRLSMDVAEAKKEVSSKRASRVISPGTPRAGGKSMTMEGLKKSLAAQINDESFSPEISDDNQEPESVKCFSASETPLERRSSTVVGMVDSGYLTFKMARLAEDILGVRKEIDETQLWKDRIRVCESDIRDLEDMITGMRGEVQLKEDRDHEILTILQTDMCELQNEVCGTMQKQTRQAHKEQMDSFRQTINVEEQRVPMAMPGVVIDREARIRTQQLQSQVNSLHHIVAELQIKAPDILFSPAPTSLPTDAQHPWGTGRQGPGTHMRSGVGTTATATSPHLLIRGRSPSPSPPASFNSVAIMEDRPAPLGGREDKEPRGKVVFFGETLSSKNTADTTEVTVVKPGLTKKEEEERTRMQQAITRLNTAHSLMAAKLEACCNQQTTEHRRLQDLMTRMHRENMNRHGELQVQINELMGEEFESLPHGEELEHGQQPETIEQIFEDNGSPREFKPPDSPQSQSKPASATLRSVKISSSTVMQTALQGFRKEFLGHLKDMFARIKRLEAFMPEMLEEVDPAVLKRSILQRFQCLACDKRVDIGSHRGEGAVPLSLPELPRIAPTSPPRQRCSSIRSSGPRVKPIDLYEIPRQCGGSYTSNSKPRRIHYFNNQGEAIEVPQEPVAVERVDVKGTDGHIYKGHTSKFGFDTSNNFAYSDERRRRLISLLQRKSD